MLTTSWKTVVITTAALGPVWVGGCEDATDPPGPPAELEVVSTVTLKQGETARLGARLLDAEGRDIPGATITFTSQNPNVVTVSATGLLVGIGGGATAVSVESEGVSAAVTVTVFGHPAGAVAITRSVAGTPFSVAIAASGALYTTRLADAFLQRGNLPATVFSDSVAVGGAPTDVAFDSAGATAFVANQSSNNVGIVLVASNIQVATVALPASPFRVIVSRDDREVYVSANDGTLFILTQASSEARSSATRAPTASGTRLRFQAGANGLALHPTQPLLYVSLLDGYVIEFNTATRTLAREFAVGGTPQDIAVTRDGTELFVANEAGDLKVISLGSGAITAVTGSANGFGLRITPDDAQVYVTRPGTGELKILDRSSRAVIRTITTGTTPRRISFDRYGTIAVVATESGSVHFIR